MLLGFAEPPCFSIRLCPGTSLEYLRPIEHLAPHLFILKISMGTISDL